MKRIIRYISSSFDTTSNGASARKLTAFWFIVLVTYVHYQHLHESNSVEFLAIDVLAAFLLLSVITVQDIINVMAARNSQANVSLKDPEQNETK